jgi:hypothetical protein
MDIIAHLPPPTRASLGNRRNKSATRLRRSAVSASYEQYAAANMRFSPVNTLFFPRKR